MSLDWPIGSAVSNPAFWMGYFRQNDSCPSGEGFMELVNHEEPVSEEHAAQLRRYNVTRSKWHYCRLDVPMNGYRLRLQFDPLFSSVYLYLCDPAQRAFALGWDDGAHWNPHVLRCDELNLICRHIARLDSSLSHPGVPLLLLYRFAPVTDSEDPERALSMRREAWRSLNLFDDQQIDEFLKIHDFRGTGVEWRRDHQSQWTLDLDRDQHPEVGLYTLRCRENPDFPFHQLAAALAAAAKTVGA